MKRIDFHTHSISANPNTEILKREAYRVRALVDSAAKKGLDAIVLTDFGHVFGCEIIKDNREINGSRIFDDNYERKILDSAVEINHPDYNKPLTVFFGEEVETKQGELLACGIKHYIEPGKDVLETMKEINNQGGWIGFPHPFATFPGAGGVGDLLEDLVKECRKRKYSGTVETLNGQLAFPFSFFNHKANKIAEELGEVKVGGSDARGYKFRQYERVGSVYNSFTFLNILHKTSLRNYIKNKKQIDIYGSTNDLHVVVAMMAPVAINRLYESIIIKEDTLK